MKYPKKQAYKFSENKVSGVPYEIGTNWSIEIDLEFLKNSYTNIARFFPVPFEREREEI